MESPKWHAGGTCNRPPGHRPQRRAQRAGHGPGTRYWPCPRQPGSGRPPRADRPPRRHHHHHRHRRRRRDRPARRLRRPDRDGDRRHRHPRRGRQARHPRHLDPDPTRPGHRPARTRPRRRARRPARHPRRQRSGRTPAGDASRWLVRGRDRGWCHGRGRSVRQVSAELSIATAGAPAPVIA